MEKKLAILLDPEKANLEALRFSKEAHPDYIFVGGSTGGDTTEFVRSLKKKLSIVHCPLSIILFPGNAAQFSAEADAILYLSLLSGTNPEYLVGQQIKSAREIKKSQIRSIPTAYILIDGGVETSTMKVTGTKPMDPHDVDRIVDVCIAAELMGKQAIYLEAGSGAKVPISTEIIKAVRANVSVRLIVGGGIRTPEAMQAAYEAGADIVVIGNHFESHPEELEKFLTAKRSYSETVLQQSGLTASAVGLKETFLYRDMQSRNVMIRDGQPYFIDFQGGRRGPTQYDVASFLWQAKANIPQSLRDQLIDAYLDELKQLSGIFHFPFSIFHWKAALPHWVLFRTLQVLGAYGYRGYFERKPHFLESIPNALRNLRDLFVTYPQLGEDYPYLRELAEGLTGEGGLTTQQSQSPQDGLTVTIYSFSFKHGLPEDKSGNGGGYVFDCRSTHNPGKYDEYKQLTGLDQPVIDFLEKDGEILTFLESVDKLIDHHVERFLERGFSHLQVAFGCTGGQHRSVYCAEHVTKRLKEKYNITIQLIHRERGIAKTL